MVQGKPGICEETNSALKWQFSVWRGMDFHEDMFNIQLG